MDWIKLSATWSVITSPSLTIKGNWKEELSYVLHIINIFSEKHLTFWSIGSILPFSNSSVSDTRGMPFSYLVLSHPPFVYPTCFTVCKCFGTGAAPCLCPVLSGKVILHLGFGPGCRTPAEGTLLKKGNNGGGCWRYRWCSFTLHFFSCSFFFLIFTESQTVSIAAKTCSIRSKLFSIGSVIFKEVLP